MKHRLRPLSSLRSFTLLYSTAISSIIALLVILLASCAPAAAPVPALNVSPLPGATASLQPTIAGVMTPDAVQVEKWKEYETALAKAVFNVEAPKNVLCEWVILGQSGQEVYVWALCRAPDAGAIDPAVIHLNADGSINNVKTPQHGSTMEANIQKIFPVEIQKKISYYLSPLFSERIHALEIHLQYRLTHSDESPLIMLTVTPMP